MESVDFASGDGTALHGWFVPAAGGAVGAATVLHVHGNAGNIAGHLGFSRALPGAGLNLFIFDYRGYGRSRGRARRREPLIADTHAALDLLLRRDDVDRARIGLYGHSLGGAIGLVVMADRPELRAGVIESAFASWRDIAANVVGGDPPRRRARLAARALVRDTHRPDEAIARIDRPLLILHGTSDGLVPISHGRRLVAAGPTARLVELAGGEHNALRETHPEVDGMVAGFLMEATKGSPPNDP